VFSPKGYDGHHRGQSQARPFQALEKVSFFPDFGAAGLDQLVPTKLPEDRLKCNCPSLGVGVDPQIDFAIW